MMTIYKLLDSLIEAKEISGRKMDKRNMMADIAESYMKDDPRYNIPNNVPNISRKAVEGDDREEID